MAAEAQRAPSVREQQTVAPRIPAPADSLAATHQRYLATLDRLYSETSQLVVVAKLVARTLGSDPDTSEAAEAVDGIGTMVRHLCDDIGELAHPEVQ